VLQHNKLIASIADFGVVNAACLDSVRGDILQALQCRQTQLTLHPKDTSSSNEEQFQEAYNAIIQSMHRSQEQAMEELKKISVEQRKSSEEILSMRIEQKCQRLLASLRFQGMDRRKDDIPDSARHTLSWVFDEKKSTLQSWLEQEHPIFCIFGKPGSGKSTMMRFLSQDERTRMALETWSADSLLIIADHYFWYTGEFMQRSHQGLLQSLLYRILAEEPSLAPFVCPERWNAEDKRTRRPWTREELLSSMENLQHIKNVKLFLLIDGLDEYYPHDSHWFLLEDLDALSKITNLKICVSSRHWPIFEDKFRLFPKISLEDNNYDDVYLYAFDELNHAMVTCPLSHEVTETDTVVQLATQVARNAQGVFLWAYLTVRALSERLRAGEGVSQLQRCLQQFPKDLHEYFHNMIYKRISSTWREGSETAQVLKIAMIFAENRVEERAFENTFMNYWFLCTEQGLRNPSFAIDMQTIHISKDEIFGMVERTRRLIHHCAKDLLSLPKNWFSQFPYADIPVQFTHQTVHDYLLSADMQQLINQLVPSHFLSADFVFNLILARFKVIPRIPDHALSGYCAAFFENYHIKIWLPKLKELLNEFDKAACEYPQIDQSGKLRSIFAYRDIVDLLVSNGKNQLAHKIFETIPDPELHPNWPSLFLLSSVGWSVDSILGRCCDNIPIEAIDSRLVTAILNHGASPNMVLFRHGVARHSTLELFHPTRRPIGIKPEREGRSIWGMFLHSWVRRAWLDGFEPELGAKLSDIRKRIPKIDDKAWPIANLLLSKGASLTTLCCVAYSRECAYSGKSTSCREYTADDILSTCAPEAYKAYLEESPNQVSEKLAGLYGEHHYTVRFY